ncbi:MAG: hypothetical protein ABJD07_04735, partial [Gemmatimonadaceae bacterium]
ISSSPKAHPDEVHLTVAAVRYDAHGRSRKGVASTFLADRVGRADAAPVFYPERVDVTAVRGRRIRVRFVGAWQTSAAAWWLDEITVVALGARAVVATAGTIVPSENPVRSGSVRFPWPFAAQSGEMAIYDFAGRPVWRASVVAGASFASWDVAASGTANGVYLVVAHGGGRTATLKLFVGRGTTR